jgi:MOSC domain-containing protein YiiM
MTVVSVNVGPVVDVPWGQLKRSAIDKRPVEGPVAVHPLGLGGDEIADLVFHGGLDQAVYAYAREDLDEWSGLIGRDIRAGEFGENLTTEGVDVNGACLGDRWRVGTTLLELSAVRIPCSVFAGFMDEKQWVKRFMQHGVPGAYFRVLEPGHVQVGDAIEVVERRDHGLTVGHVFRALTTERDRLPTLAAEPRAAAWIKERVATHAKSF